MAGNLFQFPKSIAWDAGSVEGGAKLTFTATGTTTAQNTFTDLALTVAHANPVVADSEGVFAPIYLDPTLPDYRLKYTDSADVLIYQVDDVPASQSGQSLTLNAAAPFIDLIESDAAVNNTTWRLQVNSEQFLFRLGNDALSSFADIVTFDRTANTVDAVAWFGTHTFNSVGTPIVKHKTADQSKATDITVADDTHLSGFTLTAAKHYQVEGLISYTQNVGNLAWRWQFSQTPQRFGMAMEFGDISTVEHATYSTTHNATLSEQTMTDTVNVGLIIRGLFQANASTGGTLDFQWSQQTSSANNTTLFQGSWINLRVID